MNINLSSIRDDDNQTSDYSLQGDYLFVYYPKKSQSFLTVLTLFSWFILNGYISLDQLPDYNEILSKARYIGLNKHIKHEINLNLNSSISVINYLICYYVDIKVESYMFNNKDKFRDFLFNSFLIKSKKENKINSLNGTPILITYNYEVFFVIHISLKDETIFYLSFNEIKDHKLTLLNAIKSSNNIILNKFF